MAWGLTMALETNLETMKLRTIAAEWQSSRTPPYSTPGLEIKWRSLIYLMVRSYFLALNHGLVLRKSSSEC